MKPGLIEHGQRIILMNPRIVELEHRLHELVLTSTKYKKEIEEIQGSCNHTFNNNNWRYKADDFPLPTAKIKICDACGKNVLFPL